MRVYSIPKLLNHQSRERTEHGSVSRSAVRGARLSAQALAAGSHNPRHYFFALIPKALSPAPGPGPRPPPCYVEIGSGLCVHLASPNTVFFSAEKRCIRGGIELPEAFAGLTALPYGSESDGRIGNRFPTFRSELGLLVRKSKRDCSLGLRQETPSSVLLCPPEQRSSHWRPARTAISPKPRPPQRHHSFVTSRSFTRGVPVEQALWPATAAPAQQALWPATAAPAQRLKISPLPITDQTVQKRLYLFSPLLLSYFGKPKRQEGPDFQVFAGLRIEGVVNCRRSAPGHCGAKS